MFCHRREALLIALASIWTLLDFNHFRRFKHDKAMSSMGKQSYIAR